MPELPPNVRRTLLKLRAESPPPPYLIVRKVGRRYYVYRDSDVRDKEGRKQRAHASEYIGRITDDGVFLKRIVSRQDELENAKSLIEAAGGTASLPGQEAEPSGVPEVNEKDRKILTALSMNARISDSSIAKIVGMSPAGVDRRRRQLESRYGIRYTAEIDVEKLGYLRFVIFIKFIGRVPTEEEIREAVGSDSRIQCVLALGGKEYDLMLYVLAEKNLKLSYLIRDLRSKTTFSRYPSRWYLTPFYEQYNYMPLRSDFIESLKERVGEPKPNILGEVTIEEDKRLLQREFVVLKELDADGRANFTDVDKKYEFDPGRSQYSYHKLLEKGLLKRTTMIMTKLPIRYIALLFTTTTIPDRYYATRYHLLESIISEPRTATNKYLLVGDIGLPYGVLFLFPVFHNGDVEEAKRDLLMSEGIETRSEIVTSVVVGTLSFRRFDNAYSAQNDALVLWFKRQPLQKINYIR